MYSILDGTNQLISSILKKKTLQRAVGNFTKTIIDQPQTEKKIGLMAIFSETILKDVFFWYNSEHVQHGPGQNSQWQIAHWEFCPNWNRHFPRLNERDESPNENGQLYVKCFYY